MLRRPFAFVGNDAGNGRGNSGLPRRAPRLGTLVQYSFSLPLHQEITPQQILERQKPLKAESRLQIDAPVRSRLRKWPARESVRLAEETRTHVADRRIHVHVVKNVPHRNRKGQAIAVTRKIAIRSTRSAPTKTTALSRPTPAGPAPKRAAGAWTATGAAVSGFRFFSKAKRFAQP